jgi:hypothetical protein
MHFPGLIVIWTCGTELFDLFKLVDSEDASCVPPMRTSFFPEAGGKPRISKWAKFLINIVVHTD